MDFSLQHKRRAWIQEKAFCLGKTKSPSVHTKARSEIYHDTFHVLLSNEPHGFSNQGLEPIKRGNGGGGIRTHGSIQPIHSRPRTSVSCSKSASGVHIHPY